jgi:hypothetical protein
MNVAKTAPFVGPVNRAVGVVSECTATRIVKAHAASGVSQLHA